MAKVRGGFDPDRLAGPGTNSRYISRVIAGSTEREVDSDQPDPQDQILKRAVRELLVRFDELSQENVDLKTRNASLVAALECARGRVAQLEEALGRLSRASGLAVGSVIRTLGRAEGAVESSTAEARLEIDEGYEEARTRLLELQASTLQVLEWVCQQSARRTEEASRQAAEILRETRKSTLAVARQLAKGTDREAAGGVAEGRGEATAEIVAPASTATEGEPPIPEEVSVGTPARSVPVVESDLAIPDPVEKEAAAANPSSVLELVASGVNTFTTLHSFLQALKESPGVVAVETRDFDNGTLRLALHCVGSVSPLTSLRALTEFDVRVVSTALDRIEVALLEGDHSIRALAR